MPSCSNMMIYLKFSHDLSSYMLIGKNINVMFRIPDNFPGLT